MEDAEILMLRHQLAAAEPERPKARVRLTWPDRASQALLAGTVPAGRLAGCGCSSLRALSCAGIATSSAAGGGACRGVAGPPAPPAASGGRRCSPRCTATSTPCSAGTRTRKLLAAAGAQAEHLETGCCGLVGNFGFQVGHGEVSEACAERALLPRLREAAPGAVVLADGFSCRTQIHELDSGGREAMHLAELLATAGGLDHDIPDEPPPRRPAPPPRTARAAALAGTAAALAGAAAIAGGVAAAARWALIRAGAARGSSAGSSGKRCLPCWWWARRGSHTDLMEARDRPRSRRKGTAELLAQRVAERLIDIVVQAVDINALLQMVDLNALLERVDVNTPLKQVDLNALLRQVDLNAPLREVDLNAVLARVDVNTPLKQMDVNTPLKQVDLNALLKQVDLNALLKQVDLNEVLEQVDVDAVLDRVDINDVVARIDMERLVEQTDLGAIIARSTGGLATHALDTMRSGAVGLDRRIGRWVTRLLRRKEPGPLAPPALLGLEAQP